MSIIAIIQLIALPLYSIVEYFLGKTSHGSVIGLILNIVASILKALSGSASAEEKK